MRGGVPPSTENVPSLSKNVSWETLDKLCQVRLFAAEDAPLLSGTTLQELYQAKETKFLHVVKPVSERDLPPGFVSFAAKPIAVGANANAGTMDLQVRWRCPEKFLYKPAWLVAAGDGSTEVLGEQKRELSASEAVYSVSEDLPPTPGEPQEAFANKLEGGVLPEIPLFCVEDEDEMEEGFNTADTSAPGSSTTGLKIEADTKSSQSSEKRESGEKPGGSTSTWQAGEPGQETSTFCLADADPNVAAVAAAAYAVLKAKERGSLVDHELLIKILTNPILIETLLAANQNLPSKPRDFLRAISEEARKGFGGKDFAAGRGTSSALHNMGSTTFPMPGQLGCKVTVSAAESMQGGREASSNPSWNSVGHHHENARLFLGPNQFYGRTEILGQAKGGASGMGLHPGHSLANRPDVLKDLMQQHGLEKHRNEGPLRGFAELDLRAPVLGAFSQLGVGNQVPASSHGRNDGFPQGGRYGGGEMSHSRFQKPCLYFNTPKGCRRGASCFYLHDPAPEHPYMEQGRTEYFQFQSSKRPKFGVPDKE